MALHIFQVARLTSAFLAGYLVGGVLRALFL